MGREPTDSNAADVAGVLDEYLSDLDSDSPIPFSRRYLDRVYPTNPKKGSFFVVGIFQVPLDISKISFEMTRDGYCMLKFGVPFAMVEAVSKVAERR